MTTEPQNSPIDPASQPHSPPSPPPSISTNTFIAARHVLEDQQRKEAAHQRLVLNKADWDDPADIAAYKSQQSAARRAAILGHLVPNRRCPECQAICPYSRQWVINKSASYAICRSCYHKGVAAKAVIERAIPTDDDLTDIFSAPEVRWPLSRRGSTLAELRSLAGFSQRTFAERCGWSAVYQHTLENGSVRTVSDSVRQKIIDALKIP